jgi:hypothetical protein
MRLSASLDGAKLALSQQETHQIAGMKAKTEMQIIASS